MTRSLASIRLLPDLLALLTAGVGVAVFDGSPRLLCGLAALAALGRGVAQAFPSRWLATADAAAAKSLLESVPALILLVGILVFSRPVPLSAMRDTAPAVAVDLSALPDAARDCLATEAAKNYLDELYRRLEQTWDDQEGPKAGGFVVLGFVLDESGDVRLSRVIDQSSGEYRALGSAVLEASAPFGAIEGEFACLSGLELRATLDRTAGR